MKNVVIFMAILAAFVLSSCSTLPRIGPIPYSGSLRTDLQTLAEEYVRAMDLPGMGLLYYSPAEGVVAVAAGESDAENHLPMTPCSGYEIGSTTKTFVAVVILQLIDEGKLGLDDPVGAWISRFPSISDVTVRQLLTHTGGIPEYLDNSSFLDEYFSAEDYAAYSRDDLIAAALAGEFKPLGAPVPSNIPAAASSGEAATATSDAKPAGGSVSPGPEFRYSNTGYLILADIIEAVTSNSIGTELEKRIFSPLGMDDTRYMPEEDIGRVPRMAVGYQFGNPMNDNRNYFLYNAAGGIVSTMDDMLAFARAMMDGDDILPAAARRLIEDSYIDCVIESDLHTRYSLGLIEARGLYGAYAYGHGGTTFGFRSECWYIPQSGEVIICFANSGMYRKDFRNLRAALNQVLGFYR